MDYHMWNMAYEPNPYVSKFLYTIWLFPKLVVAPVLIHV